jgi:hypothetical protein
MHAGGPTELLELMLGKLHAFRAEAEKTHEPFEIHAASADARTVDGCKRLQDLGVTDVVIGFRNPYIKGDDTQPLADKLARLERFAEDVISRVNT